MTVARGSNGANLLRDGAPLLVGTLARHFESAALENLAPALADIAADGLGPMHQTHGAISLNHGPLNPGALTATQAK